MYKRQVLTVQLHPNVLRQALIGAYRQIGAEEHTLELQGFIERLRQAVSYTHLCAAILVEAEFAGTVELEDWANSATAVGRYVSEVQKLGESDLDVYKRQPWHRAQAR